MVSSRRISRACSKAKYQVKSVQVANAQAGTPQFIMGASFGEAGFSNMFKGKAYLILVRMS